MSNSEIITFSIIAAKDFAGNHKLARAYFKRIGYFPKMLSTSHINRRSRQIPWFIWQAIFRFLSYLFNRENTNKTLSKDISAKNRTRFFVTGV